MKLNSLLLLFLVVLLSCNTENSQVDLSSSPYFNLADYIDSQVTMLNQQENPVRKVVSLNKEVDDIILGSPDYSKLLKPLRDYDINKSSFIGSYNIDTISTEDAILVQYLTNNKKLAMKKAEYYYVDNELTEIKIWASQSGLFSGSEEVLHYIPGKTLEISKDSEIKYISSTSTKVTIYF